MATELCYWELNVVTTFDFIFWVSQFGISNTPERTHATVSACSLLSQLSHFLLYYQKYIVNAVEAYTNEESSER